MKYTILFLFFLLPAFAKAQNGATLDSLVNNLLIDLRDSWTLGIDSSGNAIDIRTYNKFKSLFDTSKATIDDDFNFQYRISKKSGTYFINATKKDFDMYAHDLALEVSRIISDTGRILHRDLRNPDSISITIEREVYAEKPRRYVLPDTDQLADSIITHHGRINFEKASKRNRDDSYSAMVLGLKQGIESSADSVYKFVSISTLLITIATINNDMVLISRVQNISNTVSCMNDSDGDAILNNEDSSKNTFGDFTAHGMPDADLDGVEDKIDQCKTTYGSKNNQGCPFSYFVTNKQMEGFLGLELNSAEIHLPELNQMGYLDAAGNDVIDVLQSKKGTLKSPGSQQGIVGGASISYFFGKNRKRSGISIGFIYSRFTMNYDLTGPAVYTFKSFDGDDFYRRQVTISKLNDEIGYNIFNFPLMYSYRFKTRTNHKYPWVINMKAGPSLMIIKTRSDYDATVDIGGIYQVDSVNNDITYNDYLSEGSTYNVYVTSQGINNQNTNPGAISVFSQLSKNYDFVSNKNYRGRQNATHTVIAYNLAINGQRTIIRDTDKGYELAFKIEAFLQYAPSIQSDKKYKPIDNSNESFQSISNSNAKSNYMGYGLNAGLIYNF